MTADHTAVKAAFYAMQHDYRGTFFVSGKFFPNAAVYELTSAKFRVISWNDDKVLGEMSYDVPVTYWQGINKLFDEFDVTHAWNSKMIFADREIVTLWVI